MLINNKALIISISTLIGINYVYSVNATEYAPINGGTTYLNDGDRVIYNNSANAVNIIGINLNTPTDSAIINGAATISVTNGGQATGVSATDGSTLDLGSGTVINTNGGANGIYGLNINGSNTKVTGNNLTVNSNATAGYAEGIVIKDGASVHFTGDTVVNITNTQTGSPYGLGIELDTGSSLTLDKLQLDVNNGSGGGIRVGGGSSLEIGSGSSVRASDSNALYATGAGTSVNLNNTTIIAENGYGVNVQTNANVDLGSGTHITNGGNSMGIWAVDKANVSGDHLTINSLGQQSAIEADMGGIVKVGAGSHVSSLNVGLVATSSSLIEFKGSATERNSIETHAQYAVSAQGTNGIVNIENTDIIVDNTNGLVGNPFLGVFAVNRGVVNVKDSSISMAEDGAAVYAMSSGVVNLSGKTVINADNNSQSALATQASNAVINVKDQAIINGNIFASGAGSSINLDTTQGSVLTGYTTIDTEAPGASLNIKMANGTWNMKDESRVNNLVLNNSTVKFNNDNFETLTADSLQGNGLFDIRTDLVGQQGDLIVVNGVAEGNHQLKVTNNGSAATNGTETLTVVQTGAGSTATFGLANNVEIGGYQYGLREKQASATDFEIYSTGKTTSTADAATSFLNIAYLTNYIENQTLLQRLGDLRNSEMAGVKSDGFWMKGFGGKLSAFSSSAMKGFDMSYTGTQLGFDKNIDIQDGRLLVGIMAGFTRTNPNYREGDGTGKNYTAGIYATYLNDNGIYVDNVLKYNSMHNQFNVKDTLGSTVKGTGKTQGIMLSTEVGKRFWLESKQQGFYLEPQAQLSYGYQNGDTVHASNGLKVGLSHYNSTLGRISGIAGYQIQGENPVNIYVKTGVVREMSGGASYRFNNGDKKGYSFRSSWFDNGIGANVTINKQHNIYTEADYSTGGKFDNAMINIGYRYSF